MLLAAAPLPLTDPVYVFCVLLLLIGLAPPIATRLKLPALVVLILLGVLLGTNVLGVLARDSQLILLEKIGLLQIMLLAGLQMNLSNLKQLGMRSLIFGILTFGVPFIVGVALATLLGYELLTACLLGILFSPHTLVSYPIVTRLGIVRQQAIGVAIGGTVVTSVLTLSGLSIEQAIVGSSLGVWLWLKLLVALPLLIGLCFWGIPKLAKWVLKPESDALMPQFIFVLACLFVIASATLLLGIDSIVGAFIAGLALNSSVPLTSPLMKQIEFVSNSLFIPAFLISVGVLCNPQIFLTQPENLGLALLVVLSAVGAKAIAAWIAGQAFRYTVPEVMTMLGLTMSRAALVLVIALFGKNANILSEGLFNAIIVYIIVTCLVGPLITDFFGQQVQQQKSS
jgi:Kef-type K+ transport system membrane component KefB